MFTLGSFVTVPAKDRPDLLGGSTLAALRRANLLDQVGVVEIDPALSDTATSQREFGLPLAALANCVIVGGKREGEERLAACVVLATTRADVNGCVKRFLDVRKASLVPVDRAVELTHMEYGGITPIGLPAAWPLLIDHRVVESEVLVIGSGVRRSKLLARGDTLGGLAGSITVEALGR